MLTHMLTCWRLWNRAARAASAARSAQARTACWPTPSCCQQSLTSRRSRAARVSAPLACVVHTHWLRPQTFGLLERRGVGRALTYARDRSAASAPRRSPLVEELCMQPPRPRCAGCRQELLKSPRCVASRAWGSRSAFRLQHGRLSSATAHTVKVITVHRALVVADGPHSITECGPKARTLFSLSLSEAEDAHTLTSVKADGSTLSGRRGSAWTSGFRV